MKNALGVTGSAIVILVVTVGFAIWLMVTVQTLVASLFGNIFPAT